MATARIDPRSRGGTVAHWTPRSTDQLAADGPTDREVEVLELIAESLTTAEIADLLFISPRTVERHREKLMAKLGTRDRVQLTRYAIRRGVVKQ